MPAVRALPIFLLLPAFISAAYLLALATDQLSEESLLMAGDLPLPFISVALVLLLLLLRRFASYRFLNWTSCWRTPLIAALPAFMAPSAVFSAWTLASSHFAVIAWGDVAYFLDNLSRYPDLGPINSLVLLALLAELCMAFVPVLLAWAFYADWSKSVMLLLALLCLFAYVALCVELDVYLCWLALARMEQYGFLIFAPLTHSLAMLSVGFLLFYRLRRAVPLNA